MRRRRRRITQPETPGLAERTRVLARPSAPPPIGERCDWFRPQNTRRSPAPLLKYLGKQCLEAESFEFFCAGKARKTIPDRSQDTCTARARRPPPWRRNAHPFRGGKDLAAGAAKTCAFRILVT